MAKESDCSKYKQNGQNVKYYKCKRTVEPQYVDTVAFQHAVVDIDMVCEYASNGNQLFLVSLEYVFEYFHGRVHFFK